MAEFVRPDPTATADPAHLRELIGTALGTPVEVAIDGASVIVSKDTAVAGREAEVQAIIDAYVFDPNYGKPPEETSLKDEINQRLQALHDATATKATWDGLTAAQRQETTRLVIQAFVKVVRFVAKRLL